MQYILKNEQHTKYIRTHITLLEIKVIDETCYLLLGMSWDIKD